MPDSTAFSILGEKGPDIRESFRKQITAEQLEKSRPSGPPTPVSTRIEVKGPIDELIFQILKSRHVAIYEEIAAWSDDQARAYLGEKGEEVRAFAWSELVARQTATREVEKQSKSKKRA
jgi:hypothetical protein